MGRPKGFDRNEVLDQALRVFWRKGFADTSLHDLEQATGVNKSGLYSEFKNKDDLFTQSLRRYCDNSEVFRVLGREPLGEKNLSEFLIAGQQCAREKGCYVVNSLREVSILPPPAKKQILEHLKAIREAVHKNVAAALKESSGSQIDSVTDMVLTFSSGLSLKMNLGNLPDVSREVKEFLGRVLKSR